MFVVVSYDIIDDRRRNRVLNELKNYGNRVQYSVFECNLDRKQIKELRLTLEGLINKRKDSIHYYFICRSCVDKIVKEGI